MNNTLLDLLNCCRICLHDIPMENGGFHIDEALRGAFFIITGVELVEESDVYSNIICEHCNNKINEYVQYRNELIETQRNLYDCREQGFFEEEYIIEESNELQTDDNNDTVEYLVKDSDHETAVIEIVNQMPVDKKKCFICGLEISSNGYYQHLKRVHNYGKTYQCDYCGKKCNLKYDLSVHMRKHLFKDGRNKYPCNQCDSVLLSKSSLSNHLRTFHSDTIEIHPCDYIDCTKSFQNRMKLLQHKKTVHNNDTFPCTYCDKFFATKQYLQKHIKQCHSAKEFEICGICGKSIRQGSQFKQHIMVHSGKEFECTYDNCNKKFQFKGSLSKHIQTHHQKLDPVNCQYCNYTFPTVRHLNRHISRQHNEVKVQCEVQGCNQLFGRKDYLAAHYKNHKDIDEVTRQNLLERVKSIKVISW